MVRCVSLKDAVATAPQWDQKHLFFGGVCLIQAKRWRHQVGSAVHALTDHNAKGVLSATVLANDLSSSGYRLFPFTAELGVFPNPGGVIVGVHPYWPFWWPS